MTMGEQVLPEAKQNTGEKRSEGMASAMRDGDMNWRTGDRHISESQRGVCHVRVPRVGTGVQRSVERAVIGRRGCEI